MTSVLVANNDIADNILSNFPSIVNMPPGGAGALKGAAAAKPGAGAGRASLLAAPAPPLNAVSGGAAPLSRPGKAGAGANVGPDTGVSSSRFVFSPVRADFGGGEAFVGERVKACLTSSTTIFETSQRIARGLDGRRLSTCCTWHL